MKSFTKTTPYLTSFLAVALLGIGVATTTFAATDPADVKVLERTEFDALLAQPQDLVVIDLRRPDELTSIGGFPVYLSIQVGELGERLAWIPKDRTVVTVSNHAGRAKRGAALLIDAGFDVAGAAGAQDYEAQGGTLSRIAPPAAN
ncbi:MAG TPA: rhodanese-like domain-containing protein [Hyphomicrobiales bacterium]|nr:rhodanese-like domain-containing protein [Hyphomicrobiales bacterium]